MGEDALKYGLEANIATLTQLLDGIFIFNSNKFFQPCQKVRSIKQKVSLPQLFLSIVWLWFKVRCVPLILVDLLGTHKKIISCLEKILERLEVRKFTFCQKRPWRARSLNPSKNMSNVNILTSSRSKIFSKHDIIFSEYPEGPPGSGEHSALWIKSARPVEKKRPTKNWNNAKMYTWLSFWHAHLYYFTHIAKLS